MILREYQTKAIEDVRQAFGKYKKVILTAPTGSGKTLVALTIVKAALAKGKRIGFICDRLTLLDQTANVMQDAGIDFGIIQGDNLWTDYSKNFQICSAQTLAKRKQELNFDFCIIDEAHIMFKHQLNMIKNSNGTYFLGLTATPFTKGLGKYWEYLVTGPSVSGLIEDGFLSKYVAYGPSKPDLKGVRISAGDYNKKDLAKKADTTKLVGDIVSHWFDFARERQTIAMAVNVAHAEHIADEFKKRNIKADVIHCYLDRSEVQKKLIDFRSGEIQLLSSVDMISRGFDMPQADCLIIARPTKSLNYHLQSIGRVLRPCEGKENAIILDHAGNFERLGFPDDEFEMVLHMGGKESKNRENKEKLPKACPKCFILKPVGVSICHSCGFETKKQANVETKQGNLEELQRGRKKKETSESKEKLYAKLIAAGSALNFKPGWSANKYREYYGCWPAKKIDQDQQFYHFMTRIPRKQATQIAFGLTK